MGGGWGREACNTATQLASLLTHQEAGGQSGGADSKPCSEAVVSHQGHLTGVLGRRGLPAEPSMLHSRHMAVTPSNIWAGHN